MLNFSGPLWVNRVQEYRLNDNDGTVCWHICSGERLNITDVVTWLLNKPEDEVVKGEDYDMVYKTIGVHIQVENKPDSIFVMAQLTETVGTGAIEEQYLVISDNNGDNVIGVLYWTDYPNFNMCFEWK